MSLLSGETTSICIEDTIPVKMEDGICFSKQKAMCCKNKTYIMHTQIKLTHVMVLAMLMWQQLIVRLWWHTHLPDRSCAILQSVKCFPWIRPEKITFRRTRGGAVLCSPGSQASICADRVTRSHAQTHMHCKMPREQ